MKKTFRPTFVVTGAILLFAFFAYCISTTIIVFVFEGSETGVGILSIHLVSSVVALYIYRMRFLKAIVLYDNSIGIKSRQLFQKNFLICIENIDTIKYREYILTFDERINCKYLSEDFDKYYDSVAFNRATRGKRVTTKFLMIIEDIHANKYGIDLSYFSIETLCELEDALKTMNSIIVFDGSMKEYETFQYDFCIKHGYFDEAKAYEKAKHKKKESESKTCEDHIE